MLVIDWGTTNLRAYLCRRDGTIFDHRSSPCGIKSLARDEYARVLAELIDSFPGSAVAPVVISGMVGSRNGWIEAPYCRVPVGLNELKQALIELPGEASGLLVPGIRVVKADDSSDVIRGEEIQVFGALHHLGLASGLLCLPGTHSKWVRVVEHRISDFSTFMTGDLFQALGQTILNCTTEDAFAPEAFAAGQDAATSVEGGLLHQLFTGRTRMLDDCLSADEVSSYVSGLLLGHELNAATELLKDDETVVVIGSDQLCQRYQLALQRKGIAALNLGSDIATCKGVAALLVAEE